MFTPSPLPSFIFLTHRSIPTKYASAFKKHQLLMSRIENAPKSATEQLRESYRFIRTAEDDAKDDAQTQMARRYYAKLFREYCLADLTRYKENKIGMRWRTSREVVAGKGQFVCGNKACSATKGLKSYEINFVYKEQGVLKQALVKLRVCPECAKKINVGRDKQGQDDAKHEHRRHHHHHRHSHRDKDSEAKREREDLQRLRQDTERREEGEQVPAKRARDAPDDSDPSSTQARHDGKRRKQKDATTEDGGEESRRPPRSSSPERETTGAPEVNGDEWSRAPTVEKTTEEQIDSYLDDLFF